MPMINASRMCVSDHYQNNGSAFLRANNARERAVMSVISFVNNFQGQKRNKQADTEIKFSQHLHLPVVSVQIVHKGQSRETITKRRHLLTRNDYAITFCITRRLIQ